MYKIQKKKTKEITVQICVKKTKGEKGLGNKRLYTINNLVAKQSNTVKDTKASLKSNSGTVNYSRFISLKLIQTNSFQMMQKLKLEILG